MVPTSGTQGWPFWLKTTNTLVLTHLHTKQQTHRHMDMDDAPVPERTESSPGPWSLSSAPSKRRRDSLLLALMLPADPNTQSLFPHTQLEGMQPHASSLRQPFMFWGSVCVCVGVIEDVSLHACMREIRYTGADVVCVQHVTAFTHIHTYMHTH